MLFLTAVKALLKRDSQLPYRNRTLTHTWIDKFLWLEKAFVLLMPPAHAVRLEIFLIAGLSYICSLSTPFNVFPLPSLLTLCKIVSEALHRGACTGLPQSFCQLNSYAILRARMTDCLSSSASQDCNRSETPESNNFHRIKFIYCILLLKKN